MSGDSESRETSSSPSKKTFESDASESAFGAGVSTGWTTPFETETSASDGDIFPHYFRKSGLGKLIGKRSWGGVVGISGRGPLTDGGGVSVPLTATNDASGAYVIEGHGVDPDIEVWQDPKAMLEGRDPQLERGIAELLSELEKDPKRHPQRPADPDKSKGAVKDYTK